jgi:outer membrane protein assembly factor BamB
MLTHHSVPRGVRLATTFSVLIMLALPALAQPGATVLWNVSLVNNPFGPEYQGVTLVNDTLFYFASPTLYALDAATGGFRWIVTGTYGAYSAPVVVDGIVLTVMSQVTAWNASTGANLWTSNQPTEGEGSVSIDLNSRTVFVVVQPTVTFPALLVALSLDTGLVKWQGITQNLTDVGSGVGNAVVAADRGLVCLITAGNYVICFDITTGAEVWNACAVPGVSPSSCAESSSYQGTLYYGCDMLVLTPASGSPTFAGAYNIKTGAPLWDWQVGYTQLAALSNCTLFIGAGTHGNGISAVNITTGDIVWSTDLSFEVATYPLIANGNVLFVSTEVRDTTSSFLSTVNMTTGALTLNVTLPPLTNPNPQVQYGHGTVFSANMAGGVYALRP